MSRYSQRPTTRSSRNHGEEEEQHFIRIHLHIKRTMKKTKHPSEDILLSARPLLHHKLSNTKLNVDFEEILSFVGSSEFLASEAVTKKFGNAVLFDNRVGICGWKGVRNEDQNPKTALKGKAPIEIEDDVMWKSHVIEYSGTNSNGIHCIDIGIAVYDEEKGDSDQSMKRKSSSCTSSSGLMQGKNKKRAVNGFRAPKTLLLEVLSPVEHHTKVGRYKVRSTDSLGSVYVNFEPYIIDAYEGISSGEDSDIMEVSSISMDSSVLNVDKKRKSDDDDLTIHIYESLRHILAYNLLANEDGIYTQYKDNIGKRSCLYVTTKKTLSPSRINNTSELVSFVKDIAKVKSNWADKTTLKFRVALGARQESDKACVVGDFNSLGMLLQEEELFSQEVLDHPIEFFNGKTTSTGSKYRPAVIERFLDQLYNNRDSQLYFGFTFEMKNLLRSTFICNNDLYNDVIGSKADENYVPMNDMALSRMISFITTDKEFVDLHPEKNKFPPIDLRRPPTLNQWKRTSREGREYADMHNSNRGRKTGGKSTLDILLSTYAPVGGTATERTHTTNSNATCTTTTNNDRIGMVKVDTGGETITIG